MAKIGATVNVRRPGRFLGSKAVALAVEDLNENSQPVTLGTQYQVATQFSTQDLTLSIDRFSDRVLKPMVASLANQIDRDGFDVIRANTAQIVGTPGVPPTSLQTYLNGNAILASQAIPMDDKRHVLIDPNAEAAIVGGLVPIFNPQNVIGEQYEEGMISRAIGLKWYMDQNVVSHQFGAAVGATAPTVSVNGANQGVNSGSAFTTTLNLTTSAGLTINRGDVITLAGVYDVNPQSRAIVGSGRLKQFVVTNTVAAATGNFSVVVSPAIIYGGQFQNVSASPAAGASVGFYSLGVNGVGLISPQGVILHESAYTFANADLMMPEGVDFGGKANDKELGLSIRIVRQYIISGDALPTRIDVLGGWAPIYNELSCRVAA